VVARVEEPVPDTDRSMVGIGWEASTDAMIKWKCQVHTTDPVELVWVDPPGLVWLDPIGLIWVDPKGRGHDMPDWARDFVIIRARM
jgi:hypothetical protein